MKPPFLAAHAALFDLDNDTKALTLEPICTNFMRMLARWT